MSVEPSVDRADYAFRHSIRVRFAETDAMAIVHHSAYLPYLEETRIEYLRSINRPYTALREDGLDITVLEAFVQYRVPMRFDDVIDVHLAVAATSRASFQLAYLLMVGGEVRSTAVTVHGCVDGAGRPRRLPHWLRPSSSGQP